MERKKMSIGGFFIQIFGGDEPLPHLSWGQVAMRALAVYLISIILVRLGKSRLISRVSALDVIVAFVLGSLLSRGITGSASISNTAVSSAALIALHSLLTWLACYSHWLGKLVKGHCQILICDGVINHENLRKSHLSEEDLLEELRLNANCEDIEQVKTAYKERSGEISVVKRQPSPQVVEVAIEQGVKIIRLEVVG
jgi:uncharacterized membrane protein YcaP (DUF421 family)